MRRVWWAGVVAVLAILVAAPVGAARQQVVPDDPGLFGEWFVTATSADVFREAEAVIRALGVKVERRDPAKGVLVTRDARWGPAWPPGEALLLPVRQQPQSATIHVYVAPGWTPVRLAVGAILSTATTFTPLAGGKARGESILYGQRPLAAAIAARIAERTGAILVPIPADADARSRAASRLGDRRAAACGTAALVAADDPDHLPGLVSRVKPVYPRQELARGRAGVLLVRGEVTEHGTLTGLRWAQGVEDDNLVAATFGAAGLWRFTPPVIGDCPARRTITIEMTYTIRQ